MIFIFIKILVYDSEIIIIIIIILLLLLLLLLLLFGLYTALRLQYTVLRL